MDIVITVISANTRTQSAELTSALDTTARQQKTKQLPVTGLANTFGNHG